MTLTGIARKISSHSPMQELASSTISTEGGLTGDFRGKPGKRQITILSHELWQQTCAEINTKLAWTTRRANLLVEGIRFSSEHVGKVFSIGEVRLLITRETDPCKRMDEAQAGLKNALLTDWRGGVCCQVLCAGTITVGDSVRIEAE